MNIFFDTEFTGLHQKTTLISIGLVAESGNMFYAEFNDYDQKQIDDWIKENVINHLRFPNQYEVTPVIDLEYHIMKSDRFTVLGYLKDWLAQFDLVVMFGDCLAYDWVLFCELFGGAQNIPTNINYIPIDLATLFSMRGIDPDISRAEFSGIQNGVAHNSLNDARVIKRCYEKLIEIHDQGTPPP